MKTTQPASVTAGWRDRFLVEAKRLAKEPPLRALIRLALMLVPTSVRTKARWEIGPRPNYLLGVLSAADQASREGVGEIAVMEFGVAGGNGLVALERWAREVSQETGIRIVVYGFDTGEGLPETCGDYRDHPDKWAANDYAMDVEALKRRLDPSTLLVIGDTRETVPRFAKEQACPIGFAAVDVDLYSSTTSVLELFRGSGRRMLRRTYVYFDDVADPQASFLHRFAGELLAIDEFNASTKDVKIDVWRGLRGGRIFPDSEWIEKMYIAHDLTAISAARPERAPLRDFRLMR
jgi:hypothetical protein